MAQSLDRQLDPSEFAVVADPNTGETVVYAYRSVVRDAMSNDQKTEWIEDVRAAGARLGFAYTGQAYHQVVAQGEPFAGKYAANVRITLSRAILTRNLLDALREAIPTGIVTMANGLFGIGMRASPRVNDITQGGGPIRTGPRLDASILTPTQAANELQRRLGITQTGRYDAATREAMLRFQRTHVNAINPANVNGEPNLPTLSLLGLDNPTTATWYERLTAASTGTRTRNGGGVTAPPPSAPPSAKRIPWGWIAGGAVAVAGAAYLATRD